MCFSLSLCIYIYIYTYILVYCHVCPFEMLTPRMRSAEGLALRTVGATYEKGNGNELNNKETTKT